MVVNIHNILLFFHEKLDMMNQVSVYLTALLNWEFFQQIKVKVLLRYETTIS